jgi:hypothetical protein
LARLGGLEKAALIGGGAAGPQTAAWLQGISGHPAEGNIAQAAGAFAAVHLGGSGLG